MSSRALRRLHGSSFPELPDNPKVEDESEDEAVSQESEGRPVTNRFGLLGSNEENNEHSEGEPSNRAAANATDVPVAAVTGGKKQKANKKKKKKQKKKETTTHVDGENVHEVEDALKELDGAGVVLSPRADRGPRDVTHVIKSLLTVQHRFLNPINEIKKRFGSRVVQTEGRQGRVSNVRRYRRPTYLSTPSDVWRKIGKTGLSMIPKEVVGNYQYFTFEHSLEYQKVQAMFWEAVDSMNPDNIVALLHLHPYHIDSLLQLSDICRMSEDLQMAADLIERSLYVFEMAFHSLFNLTTGTCRLDYCQWENRGFYIALFRQIRFASGRGCYRTAVELCKLLLSLDPDGDPLCVLLMIDTYALQSGEYSFLVDLFNELDPKRNLAKLPNFAFSVPLALYYLASADASGDMTDRDKKEATLSRANSSLQSALMLFPGMLMPLLDKINVNPGSDPAAAKIFGMDAYARQPAALQQLISLYVDRCHPCWKPPDVVHWLECNVADLMRRHESSDVRAELAKCARARDACFRGATPINVYRHIVMSEVKSVVIALPEEYSSTPIVSYDPLPPRNSTQSYARIEHRRRIENQSALSAFFHSLLPNFNPQEPAPAVEGAAAAAAAPQNLREGIDALMNAMRNLLQNIQMAPPPREDEGGDSGEENDDEGDAGREWD